MSVAVLAPARGLVLATLASLLVCALSVDTGPPRPIPWSELDEYVAFVDAATKVELALLEKKYRVLTDRIWGLQLLVRETHEPRAEQELRQLVELREPLRRYLYPRSACGSYRRTWLSERCRRNALAKECM